MGEESDLRSPKAIEFVNFGRLTGCIAATFRPMEPSHAAQIWSIFLLQSIAGYSVLKGNCTSNLFGSQLERQVASHGSNTCLAL